MVKFFSTGSIFETTNVYIPFLDFVKDISLVFLSIISTTFKLL